MNDFVPGDSMTLIRVSAPLLLASLLAFPAGASAQTLRTEPIALGSTVQTELSATDPTHPERSSYYREFTFQGTAGQQVEIIVGSDELDTYAFLVGPDGAQLMSDDDGGGNLDSRILFTLPTNGTYTIQATTYSDSVTGPIWVSVAEYIVLPIQTQTLSLGQMITASIDMQDGQCGASGRRCEAWTLDLSAGQAIQIDNQSESYDVGVRLLNPVMQIVWQNDGYYGAVPTSPVFVAPYAGTYQLLVMGSPGSSTTVQVGGAEAGATVSRNVTSIRPGTHTGALEPSDSTSDYNSGVADFFHVDAEPGSWVRVQLRSADFDAYLRVLDGYATVTSNDDTDGLNSEVSFLNTGSDSLVVEASALGGNLGAYELIITEIDPGEVEPGVARVGQTIQNELGANDSMRQDGTRQDAWTFRGTAGDSVSVVATSAGQLTLTLITPMGEVLYGSGGFMPYYEGSYEGYEGEYGYPNPELSPLSVVPQGSFGWSGVLPSNGTYIINVASYAGANSIPYSLRVQENNTELVDLRLGQSRSDSLDATDSWIVATGQTGDRYSLTIEEPTGVELSFTCTDPTASVLLNDSLMSLNVRVAGSEAGAQRVSAFLSPGTYSVDVSAGSASGQAYTIGLQPAQISPPALRTLAPGQTADGSITSESARTTDGMRAEFWSIEGAAGEVSLSATSDSVELTFSVYDDAGEYITSFSPGDIEPYVTPFTASASRRYVLIASSWGTGPVNYQITRR